MPSIAEVTTARLTPEVRADLAREELRRLRRGYTAHMKWQTACTAYREGDKLATLGMRRPGKDSKHRMYASADRVHRLLALTGERPHTLSEVGALIEQAAVRLARR